MSNISFEIAFHNKADQAVIEKVKDGCLLLEQIFLDDEFLKWVSKFQWQTNDGQKFQRFYQSCGRNNKQIYSSIVNGIAWRELTEINRHSEKKIFSIVLCATLQEYNQHRTALNTLCLDLRYLSRPSYTPIHLAAALCQEYCIYLGYPPRGYDLNECWSKFTVPVAIARIVRDIAVILSRDDARILQWCMLNDSFQFDYQPCSFTFGLQKVSHDIQEGNTNQLLINDPKGQKKHKGNSNILTSLPN